MIFASEPVDYLADHGHSQKWTTYDIITKVPTIVCVPGQFEGGRKVNGICLLFDLGSTPLELGGFV